METSDIIDLAYALKKALSNDKRLVSLNELEQALDLDQTVRQLAKAMQEQAAVLASLEPEEDDYRRQQQILHGAKLRLDEHPLVRRYYEAYKPVRIMYESIQSQIFTPFNLHFCGGSR